MEYEDECYNVDGIDLFDFQTLKDLGKPTSPKEIAKAIIDNIPSNDCIEKVIFYFQTS